MSILKLLKQTGAGYGGEQPPEFGDKADSTLHYTSSLNGVPGYKRPPTKLGPDPEPRKYLDNLPE